mmetsp:Transcript_29868/g.45635  ORF Transcript_29868/g.45635 Transcript_29868/m.45635 type:complete len:115 (-) Transcript_29868:107-451(-)
MIEKVLEKAKVGHVDKAYNGQEAYDKATANIYDIIFMDINMPILSGPLATQKIRQFFARATNFFGGGLGYYNGEDFSPKHGETIMRSPFIVALTANSISKEEEGRYYECGFDFC